MAKETGELEEETEVDFLFPGENMFDSLFFKEDGVETVTSEEDVVVVDVVVDVEQLSELLAENIVERNTRLQEKYFFHAQVFL